jgi:hypothetical protein
MRIVNSPSGSGSAEQWVRERFAIEVEACRGRHAETKLVILIDADALTVRQRMSQLDQALRENEIPAIHNDTEKIARLIPKRNIETWILCLNEVLVDEDTDYKRTRDNWADLIGIAVGTLYLWSRANALVPASCVDSLRAGIGELQRLGF